MFEDSGAGGNIFPLRGRGSIRASVHYVRSAVIRRPAPDLIGKVGDAATRPISPPKTLWAAPWVDRNLAVNMSGLSANGEKDIKGIPFC